MSDDQLLDAIEAHPVLLNRPIIVSRSGRRCVGRPKRFSTSCRQDLKSFTKEDSEIVIDADGGRAR